MSHRVILVVESPLSRRDAERFGIADLSEAGFSVEAWDVCDLTLPGARAQWYEVPEGVRIENVGKWERLQSLAAELTAEDAVVLLAGTQAPLRQRYSGLLFPVLSSPAVVGTLVTGTIPPPSGRQRVLEDAYRYYVRFRERVRPEVSVPRHLDFVWAGTTPAAVARPLIGAATTVRLIHALDYDRIVGLQQVVERGDFVLLLDTMGPRHPDYVTLQMDVPWPAGCYESIVADVLADLDRRGFSVVVAAHPRARPGSLDDLYPGTPVVHGRTPELLAACTFAVALEGSTSLGMAAALGTPVLFVDAACMPDFVRLIERRFVRALRAPVIDVTCLKTGLMPPPVNALAYRRFVHEYVKRSDSPNGRFWAIVARDLQDHWVS